MSRPPPDKILEQLERICSSKALRKSEGPRKVLDYVIRKSLEGLSVTEKDVAHHALEMGDRFDPNIDANVRTAAKNLRKKLDDYYALEGAADPIRFSLPKGGYIPEFSWSNQEPKQSNNRARQPWNIPHPNRFFTGREAFLTNVRESFLANSSGAITQPQAITGLGGVGKTQTAIEYAHRYRHQYTAGLWLNAESRASLLSGCALAATMLDLHSPADSDSSLLGYAVRSWFECHSGWLLIFDNVNDLDVLYPFLPNGTGHCLITTRLAAIGALGESAELNTLPKSEGTLFLLRRAGVIARDAPIESSSAAERIAAVKIVDEVGGLALALDQAGAYIEEVPTTLAEYLRLYRSDGAMLRAERGRFAGEHPSVARTFQLAFESIEKTQGVAVDVLRASAFLAPDEIPEALFTDSGCLLAHHVDQARSTPATLVAALRELGRFALIRRNTPTGTISLHRLVQDVIKDGMDLATRRSWVENVTLALNRVTQLKDSKEVSICEPYVSHMRTVAESITSYCIDTADAGEILDKLGSFMRTRLQYKEAGKLLREALAIRERVLGPEHLETAKSLASMAVYNSDQGRFDEAEAVLRRAMAIHEKVLGPEHSEIMTLSNRLGVLAYMQARHGEAELLLRQAIAIGEILLGSDDPSLAPCFVNLARVLADTKRAEEARGLHERASALMPEDLEKCEVVIRNIQSSGLRDDLKAEIADDVRRWGLSDSTRLTVRVHCLEGMRELEQMCNVARQLLREHERRTNGMASMIEHCNSQIEAKEAIQSGIAKGIYKRCDHLRHTPDFQGNDFVIACLEDNFELQEESGVALHCERRCPEHCDLFHDCDSVPVDYNAKSESLKMTRRDQECGKG